MTSIKTATCDSFGRNFVWRPVVLLAHVLLIVLSSAGVKEDRIWNMQVKGLVPFDNIEDKFSCSGYYGHPVCCERDNLMSLAILYSRAQQQSRDLGYIELLVTTSTLTVLVILFSYLLEITFLGKIDDNNWWHCMVNKIGGTTYMLGIFLLSRGLMEMAPRGPTAHLCQGSRNHRYNNLPPDLRIFSGCYQKLGICRNSDNLTLVLLFAVGYPILWICCYFLCETVSCVKDSVLEGDEISSNSETGPPSSIVVQPSSLTPQVGTQVQLAIGGANNNHHHNHPEDQRIIMPTTHFGQGAGIHGNHQLSSNDPRRWWAEKRQADIMMELGSLLRQLEQRPVVRHNENYLTRLAISFKTFVRNGYTPKVFYSPNNNPFNEQPKAEAAAATTTTIFNNNDFNGMSEDIKTVDNNSNGENVNAIGEVNRMTPRGGFHLPPNFNDLHLHPYPF